jgi:hypothetical protein
VKNAYLFSPLLQIIDEKGGVENEESFDIGGRSASCINVVSGSNQGENCGGIQFPHRKRLDGSRQTMDQ